MPATIGGLPLHPLVVHAAVVFVPLAALAVLAYAFVPRYRAWSRLLTPVLAVLAALTVPVATSTGEGLEHMVERSAQVHEHAELGDTMIPIAFLLAAAAIGLYWLNRPRPEGSTPRAPRGVLLAVTAVAAVVSLGSIVQVVRVGHSGAESAWSDVQPQNGGGEAAGVTK